MTLIAALTPAEWGGAAAVITALSGVIGLGLKAWMDRGSVRVTQDTGKQKLLDGIIDALAEDRERNRADLQELRERLDAAERRYDDLDGKYQTLVERYQAETKRLRNERDAALQEAASLRERVDALESEVAQLRNGR